jgi:hypothetical protein
MRWLKEDWQAKAVALVLALLLWVVVRYGSPTSVVTPPGGWNPPPASGPILR